jgi:hypothetical protein
MWERTQKEIVTLLVLALAIYLAGCEGASPTAPVLPNTSDDPSAEQTDGQAVSPLDPRLDEDDPDAFAPAEDPSDPRFAERTTRKNLPPVAIADMFMGGEKAAGYLEFYSGMSFDPDGNLHQTPYRWQFEPGGPWTDWSSDVFTRHFFESLDLVEVTLEVRDRWGLTDRSTVVIVGKQRGFKTDTK